MVRVIGELDQEVLRRAARTRGEGEGARADFTLRRRVKASGYSVAAGLGVMTFSRRKAQQRLLGSAAVRPYSEVFPSGPHGSHPQINLPPVQVPRQQHAKAQCDKRGK